MSDTAPLLRLRAEIARERRHLARVLAEVDAGLTLVASRPPSRLELRGLADLAHDYYTGLEKAFRLVAVSLDGGLPEGPRWHRRLLDAMTLELPGVRPAMLSETTRASLDEYLRFRHLFRSIYGHELDWARVRPLLAALADANAAVARDLDAFDDFLAELATG